MIILQQQKPHHIRSTAAVANARIVGYVAATAGKYLRATVDDATLAMAKLDGERML